MKTTALSTNLRKRLFLIPLGPQIYSRLAAALCFPIPIIPDEALLLLRPVTSPYMTESKDAPQVGLIAE
jgi:hypothetical protein